MGVYNGGRLLDKAIASIVGQTYSSWELVVVDDGSTDSSLEVARSWARRDPRVRVVEHHVNRGHAVALNHAFTVARGELLARMDADDVSLPRRLERQVVLLDTRPDVAVVGTGATFIDAEANELGTGHLFEEHEDIAANIYRTTPLIHPSVMMRRTFLESLGGYDVRLRRAEDSDLWLRGYRRFRYHNLPEALLQYRIGDNSGVDRVTALEGAFVLARGAYRERHLLSKGPYACRFLVSSFLVRAGLRRRRLPRVEIRG